MSAEATSGGRSSNSTPLLSSLTSTKAKEVWERFADGVGTGRRRWLLLGSTEVGFADSEEVRSEGRGEEEREGEGGRWVRMGVETWDVSSSSEMTSSGGWDMIKEKRMKLRE
jgi:hypothetical protein